MPPSLIRLLPIWIWSPSRIFGTPEMSAACAIDGASRIEAATRRIVIFIGSPGAIIDTLYISIYQRILRANFASPSPGGGGSAHIERSEKCETGWGDLSTWAPFETRDCHP